MAICSKCKQNSHFTVKDAQQICGRCGATTTIAKLQTEDFKGIKIQKHYISEKREKKVAEDKSVIKHIEDNWGIYLEAFQRALRESVRTIKMKLNLGDDFEEKAKYYWLEYLKVFHENDIPLVSFFTTLRQGNYQMKDDKKTKQDSDKLQIQEAEHDSQQKGFKKKLYESKYQQKKSSLAKIQKEDIEEEYSQEDSFDQNDQNFIEKILKQKSTQEQQKKILEENDDINEIFRFFEDSQRANFELEQQQQILDIDQQGQGQTGKAEGSNIFNDPLLEMLGKQKPTGSQNDANYLATATFTNQKKLRSAQAEKQQKFKQELQGVMNNEMKQYQLQQQQQQQLEQKKKKRRRMKGRLNYIENMEECGKNYFMLVLERSEDYVQSLYNGFRSAYLHMLYLQEKEFNPLKRIRKLKGNSKGFQISKSFILKLIEKRKIPFAKKYDKIDIFHLIWAWDWAEFVSQQSTIQFNLKDDIQLLYDYLDRMFQIICKQLKEHQNIESELNKSKQQFQRTKKLNEIKQKLINKSKEIKENNKKGYLSGDEEDDQGGINEVLSKFKYENTPKLKQPKPNLAAELALEPLDLNQTTVPDDQQNLNPPRKGSNNPVNQNLKKSDEHVDQEKEIEELEFQFDRFQQRRVINLDEEQLQTLSIILEEILKERDILCNQLQKPVNPLFEDPSEPKKSKKLRKSDAIISLEYYLIPTIIYISLYSIGETYTPRDINIWIKNGLFAYNLGIAPFIKIQDSKVYWLYPQSIPSSTFIRQTAKKFVAMTNHSLNVSKKRILRQSLKLISDFGLPLEWACMIYQICVRLYKDKQDKELSASDEFDCDIVVSTSLIILLKMIYGLNDEMFGVLLNNEILEEAKEYLNERQYSFLKSIIKSFENTKFKRTNDFYSKVPPFKQVAFNIQQCIVEQKQEQVLDLTSYKQIINLSYNNLIILLQSFVDRHKLLKVHQKMKNNALTQNQQSQLSYQLMQGNKSAIKSQKMTQQAAQLQYDELEDEIQYIKQMRSHLPKLNKQNTLEDGKQKQSKENLEELPFFQSVFTQSENSQKQHSQLASQNKEDQLEPTFSVNKNFEFSQKSTKEYKFSSLLNSDLEYITNKAIKQGNTSAPPCYDYEIEKSYETNSMTLPNELKFVVDKLSIYTGEETSKMLHYLERIEGKIYKLVKKNTKNSVTPHGVFLQMISKNIDKNQKNSE
ncbi:hypothetical protein TTHERM_00317450 (macronuclear) [Tetrahymena thermophila SB210]|uniref:Uncharacterized protein n=1 Tax=Tetrahymena thermophila (strain SB210) TaxID=312017 RepID=I7M999_TETTS|nr:hypothetical protein TTHERM_00317450 [Tetrahymena thermophila SB210]EAS01181.1 hypothetical protein TTHERM_00317450 [Tetrahymena thermophila SB210]|eukprot:XP_001021426.1 hypothetical protein TTHERM_00317450 [Tetrahymena thermophila SB210]